MSNDFTVEDILKAGQNPTIRERAKAAYMEKKRADQEALEKSQLDLKDALVCFLSMDLGISAAELADAEVTLGQQDTNPPKPTVIMKVQDLSFRAILTYAGGDYIPKYEVSFTSAAASYRTVTSLEELGGMLP